MKYTYLSTNDMGDGLVIGDNGKVKVSDNYLTSDVTDTKYQPVGEYATAVEVENITARIDSLDETFQVKGEYIEREYADETYANKSEVLGIEVLEDYATKVELSDALSIYATTEYVDNALSNITPGGGTGNEFDGTYEGDTVFTGNMEITGELTVANIYDASNSRQILVSEIVTRDELDGIGTGGGNSEEYTLPIATTETLGGVKIGAGINVDVSGVISVTNEQYELPTASATTLGGIKVGNNLEISNGVLSAVIPQGEGSGFNGTYDGDVVFNGNLTVNGNIVHTGSIEKAGPLPYRNNSLKALMENGRIMVGTPITDGEIVYNPDGTFADNSAKNKGKLTEEGYLDMSVETRLVTDLESTGLVGSIAMAYMEVIGPIANSVLFAALVREDKQTSNTYMGTKNGAATNQLSDLMSATEINRILFVPTTASKGNIYVNGAKIGIDGGISLIQLMSGTNLNIMLGHCWTPQPCKIKKIALISYTDYGFTEEDGIEITSRGFVDTPIQTRTILSLEQKISKLERWIQEIMPKEEKPSEVKGEDVVGYNYRKRR